MTRGRAASQDHVISPFPVLRPLPDRPYIFFGAVIN